jgi:hypothetical protein
MLVVVGSEETAVVEVTLVDVAGDEAVSAVSPVVQAAPTSAQAANGSQPRRRCTLYLARRGPPTAEIGAVLGAAGAIARVVARKDVDD